MTRTVTVIQAGGLGGLTRTTSVHIGTIAQEDATAIEAKMAESDFTNLPNMIGAGAVVPDTVVYEVTVLDNGQPHTVRVAEPDLPTPLRELISLVQTVPGNFDTVAPPGR